MAEEKATTDPLVAAGSRFAQLKADAQAKALNGDFGAAGAAYQTAIAEIINSTPNLSDEALLEISKCYGNMSMMQLRRGLPQDALYFGDAAVRYSPRWGMAHACCAAALEGMGLHDRAWCAYAKAADLCADDGDVDAAEEFYRDEMREYMLAKAQHRQARHAAAAGAAAAAAASAPAAPIAGEEKADDSGAESGGGDGDGGGGLKSAPAALAAAAAADDADSAGGSGGAGDGGSAAAAAAAAASPLLRALTGAAAGVMDALSSLLGPCDLARVENTCRFFGAAPATMRTRRRRVARCARLLSALPSSRPLRYAVRDYCNEAAAAGAGDGGGAADKQVVSSVCGDVRAACDKETAQAVAALVSAAAKAMPPWFTWRRARDAPAETAALLSVAGGSAPRGERHAFWHAAVQKRALAAALTPLAAGVPPDACALRWLLRAAPRKARADAVTAALRSLRAALTRPRPRPRALLDGYPAAAANGGSGEPLAAEVGERANALVVARLRDIYLYDVDGEVCRLLLAVHARKDDHPRGGSSRDGGGDGDGSGGGGGGSGGRHRRGHMRSGSGSSGSRAPALEAWTDEQTAEVEDAACGALSAMAETGTAVLEAADGALLARLGEFLRHTDALFEGLPARIPASRMDVEDQDLHSGGSDLSDGGGGGGGGGGDGGGGGGGGGGEPDMRRAAARAVARARSQDPLEMASYFKGDVRQARQWRAALLRVADWLDANDAGHWPALVLSQRVHSHLLDTGDAFISADSLALFAVKWSLQASDGGLRPGHGGDALRSALQSERREVGSGAVRAMANFIAGHGEMMTVRAFALAEWHEWEARSPRSSLR